MRPLSVVQHFFFAQVRDYMQSKGQLFHLLHEEAQKVSTQNKPRSQIEIVQL